MDREDCDAFVHALMRHEICDDPMPREIAKMPIPEWYPFEVPVVYAVNTTVAITSTSGSNQTYSVPADWSSTNTV